MVVAQTGSVRRGQWLIDLRWRLEALELLTVCFGASIPDSVARLEQARGGLQGEGPGARMLASECCELALAALADGVLVAADPAPMAVIAGSVLDLADRDEALAVWMAEVLIERGGLARARDLLSRQPPSPPGSDGLSRRADAELSIAERRWAGSARRCRRVRRHAP